MSEVVLPIRARLVADGTVSALVDYTIGVDTYYRIFGGTRPQQLTDLPCIILSESDESGFQKFGGTETPVVSRIQITTIADSYEDSKTLANAITDALQNATYTTSSTAVVRAELSASSDGVYSEKGGEDTPTFNVTQIFRVVNTETS